MTGKAKKTLIIGLDGVPYGLLKELADHNIMPNFKDLRKEGIFKIMKSTIPEVSAVSWSSIITGKNPGEHGVFGFTDILDGSYILSFHNSLKLKAPPFWQINERKRYIIVNLPATYPAQKINGILITGFVSPDLEKAVYPKPYVETLRKMGYQIDIDVERAKLSPLILFKQLYETLELRLKVGMKLMDEIMWDVTMIVFTGTDRLEHFLWNAYEDKNHGQHQNFLDYFKAIDNAIGKISSRLDEEDNLIILSDHGMEKIDVNVNISTYLAEKGYLKIEDNPKKGYNSIKRETKAFALDPSRIYLNKNGKYPRGSVNKNEEQKLIQDLTDLFYELTWHGRKVIKKVYRKEEIYHGNYLENAPDLVLLPERGFNLRARLFHKEIFEMEEGLTGKHTQEDAFLYVKGPEAYEAVPNNLSVENVLTIIWALGV